MGHLEGFDFATSADRDSLTIALVLGRMPTLPGDVAILDFHGRGILRVGLFRKDTPQGEQTKKVMRG
jgi:hypothetical protein